MKQIILDKVEDLVSSFLYYDRKEDEDLSMIDLHEAIKNGEITIDEIVSTFRANLESNFK